MPRLRNKTKAALITAVAATHTYLHRVPDHPLSDMRGDEANLLAKVDEAMQLVAEDSLKPESPNAFDGALYNPATDDQRLYRQIGRVFNALANGRWWSLTDLAAVTDDPVASISAQLRHLRKAKHGSWIIDVEAAESRSRGLFIYRMRNPDGTELPPVRPGLGHYVPPRRRS